MKKHLNAVLAAILTIIILLAVCIHRDIYPFGEQCMLHIDMYHQYCPFFAEFMDKLKSGGSLFYSWDIGLGSDFLSLYAYYLASPINWLLVLVPKTYIIEAMTLAVFIKLALSASFFAHYIRQHFGTDHPAIILFGAAYALSGFSAAYAWNIMWLDVVALSPLVILGLERLKDGGSPVLYYVSLSLAILSNFYMGLILCIFLIFWFIKCQIEKNGGFVSWLRFALYSMFAGGSAAVLIIPAGIVLGSSGSQGISFPDSVKWYFNILSELARFNLTAEGYTGNDHWPNIYCGVFAVVLFVIYIVRTWRSDKRERIPNIVLVSFMFVSFSCNITDFIWHGFHFPTALPGRQSFLFIFLMLYMAFDTFLHRDDIKIREIWVSGAVIFAAMYGAYTFSDETVTSRESFVMTAIWILIYLILVTLFAVGSEGLKYMMITLGSAVIVAELLLNYMQTGLETTSRTSYASEWNDYDVLLSQVSDISGGAFYRVEKYERKTKNDAAMLGYRSATQFSSLMNLDVSHFYQKMGMEGGKNFYCYNGATPLMGAMLSVKYMLSDNGLEEGPLFELIASSGDVYLYENKYVLPLGFVMDDAVCTKFGNMLSSDDPDVSESIDLDDGSTLSIRDDADRVNALGRLLGAQGDMLLPAASVSSMGSSTVYADADGYYYVSYGSTGIEDLSMETSGGRTRNYSKVSHNYILDLGYCAAGEEITIKSSSDETLDISAYVLDTDAFLAAYDTLLADTMETDSISDTALIGHIDASCDGDLILMIANDEGWSVSVDGETVVPDSFGGAFMAIPITAGSHTVELHYTSPYFVYGLIISLCCMAAFIVMMKIEKTLR